MFATESGGNLCPVFKAEHVFFMADLFTSSGNFMRRVQSWRSGDPGVCVLQR